MTSREIAPVDPADHEALLARSALLGRGFTAGREAAWWADDATTLARYGDPRPGRCSVLLLATRDGEPVGAALAAAVREALAGRAEVVQAETYSEAGVAFALSQGMRLGNQEHRLVRDLPLASAAPASTAPAGGPHPPRLPQRRRGDPPQRTADGRAGLDSRARPRL